MMLTERKQTIVGMGVTGLSCARYLASINADFCVVDTRDNPQQLAIFRQEFPDVELTCGDAAFAVIENSQTLVMSPGLDKNIESVSKAVYRGAELTNDIAIFAAKTDKPIIAITGSNGKTTVTTLISEMLKNDGFKVNLCGNIGIPVLDVLTEHIEFDISVIELSSFQLEIANNIQAFVATVLNITPDHMDRYDCFESYVEAKHHIFAGCQIAVINADDNLTIPSSAEHIISVSLNTKVDYYLSADRQFLMKGEQQLLAADQLKIKGEHNLFNALVAIAVCQQSGADQQKILSALTTFQGLAHRCEWVVEAQGIAFYNDSKATNVGATIAAIDGLHRDYNNLLLIAGGQDKDSDFKPLAEVIREHISYTILFGQDAAKIAQALAGFNVINVASLDEAVVQSLKYAEPGDAVLFSPACASFDMFFSYEQRGDQFKALVTGTLKNG